MLFNKFNNWLRSSVRLILTVLVCGLLFIASANPAQATTSKTTDGEANLNKIQDKTDSVADSKPLGMKEVIKESQKGLNEVQGSADADKMISPDEASGTTVQEKAESFFDKLSK
jgi:hypothetical protein